MPVCGPKIDRYAGAMVERRVKKRITREESCKPRPKIAGPSMPNVILQPAALLALWRLI
jgi:hypothetical protein